MRSVVPGILPSLAIDRAAAKPLYRQICDAYREAIVERKLRPGQRLPSTRALADELGISRIPVLNAFDQLLAEGYFESRRGSGTYVASGLDPTASENRRAAAGSSTGPGRRAAARLRTRAQPAPQPWLGGFGAFRLSEPALDDFPMPAWSRLVARHARTMKRGDMSYGSAMGSLPFREAVAAYLRTARAVSCEADQIMVVSGSQQALVITARVLLDEGERVWFEEPGYAGARDALVMAGARLVPVPVDDKGLNVAAGIRRARDARAAYVTPSHQYPLGVTMTPARRLQLLAWAQAAGAWIIEDDYDSEYRYEGHPLPALQGLDRDRRVIYIGTFSKVLFPGLRVGYVVIPRDLIGRFMAVRDAMDICPPGLFQAVLADFIAEGHFARHLRRTRSTYAERRRVLVEALRREFGARLEVIGAHAGIHLTAIFDRASSDHAISARAARDGLWAMPLSACYLGAPVKHGFVLGYGGTNAARIPAAVRQLGRAMGGARPAGGTGRRNRHRCARQPAARGPVCFATHCDLARAEPSG